MKTKLSTFTLCFVLMAFNGFGQGIAIKDNNTAPNINAILDIDAANNDKGILIPRLTTFQRTNMGDLDMAEDGLLVYDETTKSFWHWIGYKWMEILSEGGRLADTDFDTEVKVEESADEDIIRFFVEGQQKMVLTRNTNEEARLDFLNNSNSMFLGQMSGNSNESTAFHNLGVGNYTLFSNTSGTNNLAIGENALSANTTGSFNLAIGEEALLLSSTASSNMAIGFAVLRSNTTGINNVGFGQNVLRSNTEGSNNIGVGINAMLSNDEGSENLALGTSALMSNVSGEYNIALGSNAFMNNINGDNNIVLGSNALSNSDNGYDNIVLGSNALATISLNGSGIISIGSSTLEECESAHFTTVIGDEALSHNKSSFSNTVLGARVMEMDTTGDSNTAIGSYTMRFAQASKSTAVGQASLFYNNGIQNSAYGWHSMKHNTTGSYNTAIGALALDSLVVGSLNAAMGHESGSSSGEKLYCSFVGSYARSSPNLDVENSTALGYETIVTADNQVRVGNASVTSIGGLVAWTNLSDGRFKANIQENVPGLDFISKLRPVTYNLDIDKYNGFLGIRDSVNVSSRNTAQLQTGFIAQEVQDVAENLGYEFSGVDMPTNENSVYGLRYAEFVTPMIKAIQEQQQMIMELRDENAALRDRLTIIEEKEANREVRSN